MQELSKEGYYKDLKDRILAEAFNAISTEKDEALAVRKLRAARDQLDIIESMEQQTKE